MLNVSITEARAFVRRALLLDEPVADVGAVLSHLGYVQLDPVNVCGRMHDLILRNRVIGYREGDLMRYLHGDAAPLAVQQRTAFEHHLPSTAILVAFPLPAWPYLLSAMDARTRRTGAWSGRLTPREKELSKRILGEIAERGPLSSEHIDDDRRGRRVWGASSLAKSTLQKLFFHGRVLIARRENHRRLYDLPERVLPADVLARPEPTKHEVDEWLVLTKLRQRRLVWLQRKELPLAEPYVEAVKIEGVAPTVYCLREDLLIFEGLKGENTCGRSDIGSGVGPPRLQRDVRLLAPLDPLVYDRKLTRLLWNFDYVWEAYTPAAKRVRGHYALPVLSGLELVGHVDPKAKRDERRLHIVSKKVRRGHSVSAATRELAEFLGLKR
jgi:uncharacterized protein YcaQ